MNKFILILSFLWISFAGETQYLEDNFKKNILKFDPDINIFIENIKPFRDGIYLATIIFNNQKKAIFLFDDGSFILNNFSLFSDKNSNEINQKYLKELSENQKIDKEQKVLNAIKKEHAKAITLIGNKNKKLSLYVFTDPNCPYCKDHLSKLESYLNDYKEVHLFFVGVINKNSILKSSDLISSLEKTKEYSKIIALIKEVYFNPSYSIKSKKINDNVLKNSKILIDNSIEVVPYYFESY